MPSFEGPSLPSNISVVGVNGSPSSPRKTPPLNCCLANNYFAHSFLIIPSCPTPLLGRDVLSQLKACISIPTSAPHPTRHLLLVLTNSNDSNNPTNPFPDFPIPIDPQVWDTSTPVVADHHSPILIKLKNPSQFPTRPQFSLSPQHLRGLKPIITRLLSQHILIPIHSPCNTPILPVKKADGTFWLVQDLCLINEAVCPTHLVVPNPYTLLSLIPPNTTHFTVLDLKDAFFTIPLHPDCQFLFAFTWEDPDTHTSTQLTWTVLPQGFRDSPHFFGQALAKDLASCPLTNSKILQYVDDLLLCSPMGQDSLLDTAILLNHLGSKGYRISKHKAQLAQQVSYI